MAENLALSVGRYGATQMPQYSNLLTTATNIQGARQQQQMNALKMQQDLAAQQQAQQLNQLYGEATTPTGLDLNRLIPRLAQSGMGAKIPEVVKAQAELEAKRATTQKTTAETRKATLEADIKQLDQDLGVYDANVNSQEEHDRWLAGIDARGDPIDAFPRQFTPQVKQNILRMGLATKERLQRRLTTLPVEGGNVVISTPEYGGGPVTEVAAARGPAPSVQPVTVMGPDGVPVIQDARTGRIIGQAPPASQGQRRQPIVVRQGDKFVYMDPDTQAVLGEAPTPASERAPQPKTATVMRNGKPTVINLATGEEVGEAPPVRQGQRRAPIVVREGAGFVYKDPDTGEILGDAPTPSSERAPTNLPDYRRNAQGAYEFVPGGPADPEVIRRNANIKADAALRGTLERTRPKVERSLIGFENRVDKLQRDLDRLVTHPGFNGIFGYLDGRLPALTQTQQDAYDLYQTVISQGSLSELTELRLNSPTGGALGNQSNADNQLIREAFAAFSRTLSEKEAKNSIRLLVEQLNTSKKHLRDAYEAEFSPILEDKKSGLKVGDVMDGYRFKGGNPKEKENWEKVQ